MIVANNFKTYLNYETKLETHLKQTQYTLRNWTTTDATVQYRALLHFNVIKSLLSFYEQHTVRKIKHHNIERIEMA